MGSGAPFLIFWDWLTSEPVLSVLVAVWSWVAGRLLGPLLAGLILAAFGTWWITRLNEKFRGKRDHATKSVDALREQLESVVSLASEYWLTTAKKSTTAKAEAEISYKLDDISALVQVCASELWQGDGEEGPQLVADLMAAIVTEDFATPTRGTDASRPLAIANAAMRLSQRLTANRHAYFS